MDIDVTQASGVTVVAPQGDLDMATVDEVRRTLAGLIDGGQSRVLTWAASATSTAPAWAPWSPP